MLAYNIDELRDSSGSTAKLLFDLWEIWGEAGTDDILCPEEKIVRDAWVYDTGNGNGIRDMLINERFDEIAAGLDALRQLGSPELNHYVESIAAAFKRFGINCFDSGSLEAGCLRGEPPRATLEAAETPFLPSLWDGIVIEAVENYIKRHIEAFRTRRPMT